MARNQYDDDLDDDQQDDDTSEQQQGWRKRITKDRDTARTERDTLKRELAFLKAGVNPDDPKAKYFVKGYDGELDPAAIKAEAAAAGLLEAKTDDPPPKDEIPDEEKAAHERVADTTTGAAGAGERDFNAEMLAAKTEAEFHAIAREAGVRFAPGAYTAPVNS